MMATLRILAVVTALVVTACGGGAGDPARTARPQSAPDPTSTTAAPDDGRSSARQPEEGEVVDPEEPAASTTTDARRADEVSEDVDGAASGSSPDDVSVYVPPAGQYIYDVTGHVETTGISNSRESVPPTSTDHVDVSEGPTATRLTVVTRDEGSDASQEIVVEVTDGEARLVRLGHRPDSGGFAYSVHPDPPALLARLPYRVDDSWEIAWDDPALGISGIGTGRITGRETVTTPAGRFDTFVVTVEQRLRGTINGTLTVTSWIDPARGIQARQHIVSDFSDATGASRSDTVRVLRHHRAG